MVRVQLTLASGRFGGFGSWVESTLYLLVTITILFEGGFYKFQFILKAVTMA